MMNDSGFFRQLLANAVPPAPPSREEALLLLSLAAASAQVAGALDQGQPATAHGVGAPNLGAGHG